MYRILFILAFISSTLSVCGQRKDISFKHITMDMGLSHNAVNDIYCDEKGFIWFSTVWGLNRYDGYKMKTFIHADDSISIPDNYLMWVRDLSDGKKLVHHGSGYSFYDEYTERFADANRFLMTLGLEGHLDNVYVDRHANIWLSMGGVTRVYSSVEERFLDDENAGARISSNVVSYSENDSVVVALCDDGSVVSFSQDKHKKTLVVNVPENGRYDQIFVDSDGDYWLIKNNQSDLWYYDHQNMQWSYCTASASSLFEIPGYPIIGFAEDKYKRIWVASDHGGICIIDKVTRHSIEVKSKRNDSRSILSNSNKCIYSDRNGNMWVGDNRDGVSLYNESVFKFEIDLVNVEGVDKNFVAHVNTIEQDHDGNMWYGTDGCGVLRVDAKTGINRVYRNVPGDPRTLSGDVVVDILSDSHGNIWFGSYHGGLSRFDGVTFHSYRDRKDVPAAASFDYVWSLAEDANKNIWVGALGLGIAVYNPVTDKWKEYGKPVDDPSSGYIMQIYPTAEGPVYIASASGVLVYNPMTDKFTRLVTDDGNVFYENVNDVILDSRGLLWIGSRSGLSIVDTKTNRLLEKYSIRNGLPNDVVTSIVEDSDLNIWATTTCGITNIFVSTNPRTNEYSFETYNYNEKDGFLGGTLNSRAIKRTKAGEIIVGGDPGIARFKPNEIVYNQAIPSVCFTDISVFGQPVGIGEKSNGHIIADKALPFTDHIVLNYADNMFSVSFSTLSFILPEKVTFSYMLEGFNDKWIETNSNTATYTNLAPGTYTLKVKAANCDGFLSSQASELNITILPPWWRTAWAYMAYVMFIVVLVSFIRRQIQHRERDKYKLQQIEAEIAKKYEMDEVKLNFFTNISHELRTPLGLIIAPLDNLISSTKDNGLKEKYLMIHRNAEKLLNMVNQLLDFRKVDSDSMPLTLSNGDLVSFVRQCGESFHALSEKSIKYTFHSDCRSIDACFDRDKMSKIVNNLLSNAFKFTPENGKIDLSVSRSSDGNMAEIRVSDNGIGIDDKYKEHIFERFYQVPDQDSAYAGSGIGLHLVKDFVEMHDGSIEVSDNVGGGTLFTVTLPIKGGNEAEPCNDDLEVEISREKKLVVIVDDNADFLTLLDDTLRDSYDIVKAHNGKEALAQIESLLPDLVITDVMMPVMDGNELCKKIKTNVLISHIPVIMLTAKSAEEHKIEGLENGADDYMTKPFNTQILRLKVERLIELGYKRQEKFRRQLDPEPSDITITTLDEQFIQKAIKYVEDNISRSELSVEELSKMFGMSRTHLYKKIMSITGRSPLGFIRLLRLKRAAKLLSDKQQTVSDVAYAVGFNNPKYFSRQFKDEFGELPSVYQSKLEDASARKGIENALKQHLDT